MTEHGGTIALITGATRGIGRATADGLGRLGMTVLLGARDPGRGAEVAGELRTAGADAHAVHLDVADPETAAGAAAWIAEHHGRLDVLVNNAGISGDHRHQSPGAVDLDVVREVFATNVLGVIAVTEAMLPLLRRSGAARIVNLSSSVGSLARMSDRSRFTHVPAVLAYPPSKAALNQVTVQYAKGLAAEGILVNAADPGACATDFTARFTGLTRTAADGAAVVIELATLPADGPTGAYLADSGPVPW
jgi:NAD(P)-dependent dehydrogenase (short-subunit alcohol dehydrogenase family)